MPVWPAIHHGAPGVAAYMAELEQLNKLKSPFIAVPPPWLLRRSQQERRFSRAGARAKRS
jgi:hypothetical protein